MLSGSTSCSSIAKGNVWLCFHEGTREGNEMKHPLSGLHLEARCSIELGNPHLFTINASRVNVVFWVFGIFFSQEDSLGKAILLSKAQGQHKTFSGPKLLNYLLSIRQAAVLHLASCFIA